MGKLNLVEIAAILEGLEDTLIYKLIDRAQYHLNSDVYETGKSGFSGSEDRSLLDVRLRYHEEMDSAFGRFLVPEERPFLTDLPKAKRAVSLRDWPLAIGSYNQVNLTHKIWDQYRPFLNEICLAGDDGDYGSSVECDIFALQALSRRIHFGSFYVAESKYQDNSKEYQGLIDEKNIPALMKLLTRQAVEDRILERVRGKVNQIQSIANPKVRKIVNPELVVGFYRDTIIPLTKDGEIEYLTKRLKK